MPTFSNIDGEESATVTFTVAAVSLTRNSSAELQEILVIGDPEVASSLGLARVTNTAPASTNAALNVRIASGPSSIADLIMRPVAPSTYGDGGLYRVAQSTAGDLNVTVAGYSTTVNISSVTGPVNMRSSAANALVTVYQSTAADLNVTVAGYSTIAAVSSVSGRVGVMPFSTLFASSAGFHFDSSGALQITGAVAAAASSVFVNAPSTANAQNYLPVRLSDGSTYLTPGADYIHGSTFTASTVAGPTLMLAANIVPTTVSTGQFTVPWGTPQGAQYMAVVTDSGASIMDSTNRAINVNVVAGAAGGSTIMTVSTGSVRVHQSTAGDLNVTVAGYSTTVNVSSLAGAVNVRSSAANALHTAYQSTYTELQGLVGLRDRDQSTATAAVSNAEQPASTAYGLVVRFPAPVMDSTNHAINVNVVAGAAGGSTIMTVSTGSVRVHQSTAADLNVTVAGYSTIVAVSSIAGPVTVRSSAANALVSVYQSTAADLNVTVAGYSTTVNVSSGVIRGQVYTSSGGGIEGSTQSPAHGVTGLHVRQVPSTMQSTAITVQSSNSTVLMALISSVAGLTHKVYAISLGASTTPGPSTIVFLSSGTGGDAGAAKNRWQLVQTSGVFAAHLAVNPPAFLFKTDASEALNCRIETGTTRVIETVALSWVTE